MTPAALTPAARRSARSRTSSRAPDNSRPADARPERQIPRRVSGPVRGRTASAPNVPASRGPAGARAAAAAAVALPRPVRAPRPRAVPDRSPRPRELPRPGRVGLGRTHERPAVSAPLAKRVLAGAGRLPDHPLLDRIVRGRAWIALLGVMLVGIVAMQVEVLKYGASIGRALQNTSIVQSRNELLRAEVSSLSSDQRIERYAARMGLLMPQPQSYTFLRATPEPIGRALASIRPPSATFQVPAQSSAGGG